MPFFMRTSSGAYPLLHEQIELIDRLLVEATQQREVLG